MHMPQVNLITASPNTTLNEAEERLKGIEGLPVVDDSGKVQSGRAP
jgi:CBS domain-containing protein